MTNAEGTAGTPLTTPGAGSGIASPSPSSSRASSAATTSTRKLGSTQKVGRPKGTHRPPSQAFKNDVAVLRSEGLTQGATAKLLGVGVTTIQTVEHLPDVKQRIATLRDQWTKVAQEKITGLAGEAWDMAQEAASQRDARAFNSASYGLLALEKVSASVAGVGQKVEVTGIPESPKVDIKVLLAKIFKEGS